MTGDQASRSGVMSTAVTGPGPDGAGTAGATPGPAPVQWTLRRTVGFAAPAVWAIGVLVWELLLPVSTHCVALLAATPALACAGTGARLGVWLGGGFALFALYPLGTVPVYEEIGSRFGIFAAILCVAVASCYTARRRARLTDELVRTREVATAAQQALIRPLPPRFEGFTVAAGYLSAAQGAAVGGDLYDAVATAHGIRVVIGDVRGHGLGAVGTVAAVLGSFREAAYDEARLERVPHRLERALDRHLAARRHVSATTAAEHAAPGSDGSPTRRRPWTRSSSRCCSSRYAPTAPSPPSTAATPGRTG